MRNLSAGYTLVELIIVIVISALLLTVSYAQYREFSRRQEVQVARRQIEGDLRRAQADALAGRKPSGCSGTLIGYAFEITTSPSYEIYGLCSAPVGTKLDVKTAVASSVVSLSASPNVNPIIFKPFTYGTNLNVNSVLINISHIDVGASATVEVARNGEIR